MYACLGLSAPDWPLAPSSLCALQAQELFQKDAALITPEALATVKAALAAGDGGAANGAVAAEGAKASTGASGGASGAQAGKKRAVPRKAAGETWEDPTLVDFPESVCLSLLCALVKAAWKECNAGRH